MTKVHLEAVKYARLGFTIVLIGHRDHDEVVGTLGEAPANTVLVETPQDVEVSKIAGPDQVVYLTQTTLSLDETRDIIAALKAKFPAIQCSAGSGYLLCHREPAAWRQSGGARDRSVAGRRIAQQFEFEAPGGGL